MEAVTKGHPGPKGEHIDVTSCSGEWQVSVGTWVWRYYCCCTFRKCNLSLQVSIWDGNKCYRKNKAGKGRKAALVGVRLFATLNNVAGQCLTDFWRKRWRDPWQYLGKECSRKKKEHLWSELWHLRGRIRASGTERQERGSPRWQGQITSSLVGHYKAFTWD